MKHLCRYIFIMIIALLTVCTYSFPETEKSNTTDSHFPALYLMLKQNEAELYQKNIDKINFSFYKFKDILPFDLIEQSKLETSCITETTAAGCIDIKTTQTLDFQKKDNAPYILDYKNETNGYKGFFGISIDSVIPSKGDMGEESKENKEIDEFIKTKYPSGIKIFQIRDIEFFMRMGKHSVLFWVYNTKTGKPLQGAEISAIRGNETVNSGKTDINGLLFTNWELKPDDFVRVKEPGSNDWSYCRLRSENFKSREESDKLKNINMIFTDRVLYKPGSDVNIGCVIKKSKDGELLNPEIKKTTLIIKDTKGEEVLKTEVKPDRMGGFSYTWKTTENTPKGYYQIYIECDDDNHYEKGSFRIDYYQPDTIKLEVKNVKNIYTKYDRVAFDVFGKYLSGNPMSGDSLEYRMTILREWYPYPFKQAELGGYRFDLNDVFIYNRDEEKIEGKGVFDHDGKFRIIKPWDKLSGINCLYGLRFDITGISSEGKEVSTSEYLTYIPGNRVIGIAIPSNYNEIGKPVTAELAAVDSSGNFASTSAIIGIYRINGYAPFVLTPVEKYKKVRLKLTGKDKFKFTIDEPGCYLIKCDAVDENGNTVSSSASFSCHSSFYDYDRHTLSIEAGKEMYRQGEKIDLSILASHPGKALITVERNEILDYFPVDIDNFSHLSLEIKKNYFPEVEIHVFSIGPNYSISEDSIKVPVETDEKVLNVQLTPQSDEILPRSRSKLKVTITDSNRKGKKTNVLVYAVNEGTLKMSGYGNHVPDLLSEFYFYNELSFNSINSIFSEKENNPILNNWWALCKNKNAIAGRVTDPACSPIREARVVLTGGINNFFTETLTDVNGYFFIPDIPSNFLNDYCNYKIEFIKEGYITSSEYLFRYAPFVWRQDQILFPLKEQKPATGALSLSKCGQITGKISLADGTPVPGAIVVLSAENNTEEKRHETLSTEKGFYALNNIPNGKYQIIFLLNGFKRIKKSVEVKSGLVTHLDVILEMIPLYERVTGFRRIRPEQPDKQNKTAPPGFEDTSWQSLIRNDFQEVLFFKLIETDENGEAEINFKTSDMLSTYRVMAVAYAEDSFGSAETYINVTKNLY